MKSNLKTIKKLVDKYRKRLGLEDLFIDIAIMKKNHVISNPVETTIKRSENYAEVSNKDYSLNDYTIVINNDKIGDDLEDTICHEMLHILFWKFGDILESLLSISSLTDTRKKELILEVRKHEHDIIENIIEQLKK